jgi:hypothetical protein
MYPVATNSKFFKERQERFIRDLEQRTAERLGPEAARQVREMFPARWPGGGPRPLVPRKRVHYEP